MNKLKAKYKQDFARLQTLINEFDPCGLIASGSPVDEYDCLTDKILGLKHRGESKEKMRTLVLGELSGHFGIDFDSVKDSYKIKFDQALEEYLIKVSS